MSLPSTLFIALALLLASPARPASGGAPRAGPADISFQLSATSRTRLGPFDGRLRGLMIDGGSHPVDVEGDAGLDAPSLALRLLFPMPAHCDEVIDNFREPYLSTTAILEWSDLRLPPRPRWLAARVEATGYSAVLPPLAPKVDGPGAALDVEFVVPAMPRGATPQWRGRARVWRGPIPTSAVLAVHGLARGRGEDAIFLWDERSPQSARLLEQGILLQPKPDFTGTRLFYSTLGDRRPDPTQKRIDQRFVLREGAQLQERHEVRRDRYPELREGVTALGLDSDGRLLCRAAPIDHRWSFYRLDLRGGGLEALGWLSSRAAVSADGRLLIDVAADPTRFRLDRLAAAGRDPIEELEVPSGVLDDEYNEVLVPLSRGVPFVLVGMDHVAAILRTSKGFRARTIGIGGRRGSMGNGARVQVAQSSDGAVWVLFVEIDAEHQAHGRLHRVD